MALKINPDAMKTGREIVRHKIAQGTSIFRILPPTDNSNGYPYKRWMITWGLLDPQKETKRPYASSLTTEQRCPIRDYYYDLLKVLENKEAVLKTKGISEDQIKSQLKDFAMIVRNLRLRTVYAYNAVDQSGKIGILEVGSTVQNQIKKIMSEYMTEMNQDPTSLNNDPEDSGIWLKIERQGEKIDTKYYVSKNQKPEKLPDGRRVVVDDATPLPKDVIENYDSLAYDLAECYQVLTYDELYDVLAANVARWSKTFPEVLVGMFSNADLSNLEKPKTETTTKVKTNKKQRLSLRDSMKMKQMMMNL